MPQTKAADSRAVSPEDTTQPVKLLSCLKTIVPVSAALSINVYEQWSKTRTYELDVVLEAIVPNNLERVEVQCGKWQTAWMKCTCTEGGGHGKDSE